MCWSGMDHLCLYYTFYRYNNAHAHLFQPIRCILRTLLSFHSFYTIYSKTLHVDSRDFWPRTMCCVIRILVGTICCVLHILVNRCSRIGIIRTFARLGAPPRPRRRVPNSAWWWWTTAPIAPPAPRSLRRSMRLRRRPAGCFGCYCCLEVART